MVSFGPIRFYVIGFLGKSLSDLASRALAVKIIYFDTNVLDQLGDQKTVLAEEIAELKQQARQFEYVVSDLSFDFESQTDRCIKVVGPVGHTSTAVLSFACGKVPRWDFETGLIASRVPAGYATMASAWHPFCGFGNSDSDHFTSAPLVLLAQVLLVEAISKSEKLLSLVIADSLQNPAL